MPDTPAPVQVGPGAPLPPQEPVEAPANLSDTIREVVEQAQEAGEIQSETGDAIPVGEAETLDVGEQTGDRPEVDGEGEDQGREVQGAEGGETPPEGEGEAGEVEGETPPEPEMFRVSLPGRREGDEPLEIDLENVDPEVQEGFRRLMNEGMRREQFETAMGDARALHADVQDMLIAMDADPINFVQERTTPEIREQLAFHILSDPEIYEKVIPEIARWDNSPDVREAAQARLERDRVLSQRHAEEALQAKAARRENAKQVHEHIQGMVPETAPEHIRELFMDQAVRVISTYTAQHNLQSLDVNQIEPILRQSSTVLRLLEAQGGPVVPTPNPTEPSSPGPATPAAPGMSLREATETAERFRKTSAQKRQATAVAPPGAGPAPTQPPPMPEEAQRSVKESIKWYKRNVLGKR